jgi:hypothetical protein
MLLLSINQATGRIEIRQCPSEPGPAIEKKPAREIPKRGKNKKAKEKSRARESQARRRKKKAGLARARQKDERKKPGS